MTFKHEARRPSTTWVVVADRARARILAGEWPALDGLREIDTLVHPEGEMHQRDVESDAPGRLYESQGPKHAPEARTDFKHRTAAEFAREIVRKLQQGKDENAYGRLILVAPPLLLGVLREQMPEPLNKLTVGDLDKDLSRFDDADIRSEIQGMLDRARPT